VKRRAVYACRRSGWVREVRVLPEATTQNHMKKNREEEEAEEVGVYSIRPSQTNRY
jgi:hypothetical protein